MGLLSTIFGLLTALISDVLESLQSWGAPWWLSIVLLTILVRVVLFPLTMRQVRNVRAMQELKPDMDSIRARYKHDRQKQQEAIMKLYRERRVNPLAGFLPVLVQIPVFVTMYRVIRNHEETFPSFASGGLLWFLDLTKADPYFVLPVLSASILFVAGGISSRNVDPGQKRMMRLMPIAFTALIARFPAGLFVYWITSNTITLIQNYLIYYRVPTSQGPRVSPPQPAEWSTSGSAGVSASVSKPAKQSAKKNGRRERRKKKKK